GARARMLELVKPAQHVAGVQSVNRTQILATAIADSLWLLLRPCKAKPGGSGQAVDEQDLVTRQTCELGVFHDFVVVCLAIGNGWWQWRIRPAEGTGKIAAFVPRPRAHARDGKISHGDVAGLDVDEKRRCQQLCGQGAQQRCFASPARTND